MWVSGGCQEGEQQSTEMQIFSESVEGLRDWAENHNAFQNKHLHNRIYAGRDFFGVPLLI